jgi:hypothetical protein
VDNEGNSTYVTEGVLRASHRVPGKPSFGNFGLPWHDHFKSGLRAIPPEEAIELALDLLPTAYHFAEGRRIRVTIAFADMDNFETPIIEPAPMVHLLRDKNHPSFIELPLVRQR